MSAREASVARARAALEDIERRLAGGSSLGGGLGLGAVASPMLSATTGPMLPMLSGLPAAPAAFGAVPPPSEQANAFFASLGWSPTIPPPPPSVPPPSFDEWRHSGASMVLPPPPPPPMMMMMPPPPPQPPRQQREETPWQPCSWAAAQRELLPLPLRCCCRYHLSLIHI